MDGNVQVARILTNLLLRRAGYSAIPIYPNDRREYLGAIELADRDKWAIFTALIAHLAQETVERLLENE